MLDQTFLPFRALIKIVLLFSPLWSTTSKSLFDLLKVQQFCWLFVIADITFLSFLYGIYVDPYNNRPLNVMDAKTI